MSMHSYPGSEYLLLVSVLEKQLKDAIGEDKYAEFMNHIGEWEMDQALHLCKKMFKDLKFAEPYDIIIFSGEDDVDEVTERYVPYFLFNECDLYVRKDSPAMARMRKALPDVPTLTSYSVWG